MADGVVRRYPLEGTTVGALLAFEHIALGKLDEVTPPPATPLTRNLAIKVTRVRQVTITVSTKENPVVSWATRTRENLRRVLAQRGMATDVTQTVLVTYHDGVQASRQVVKTKKARRAFFTLTLFNDQGFPSKKYDLLKSPNLKMLATGYYVGDPMVPGDETRLGYKLQRGLVAVDPKVIPLGSRLYIPGYGYAFASDTGSAIKGMRIDLAVKDAREERRYNHRRVTIYILGKSRKW